MRSTTLSVKPRPRMRSRSHFQTASSGWNDSRRSSHKASRNCVVKNGLPPVFWWTRWARGSAADRVQRSVSATRSMRSARVKGPMTMLGTRTGSANGGQGSDKRMSGADLVVAVCAYQKQVADLGVGRELFQKLERCRVHPLEVIEKEHHRVFFARKHRHELPEHPLEALLRFQRRQGPRREAERR